MIISAFFGFLWNFAFLSQHSAPLFLLLFGNAIPFFANPWSGKGRIFMAKKGEKLIFNLSTTKPLVWTSIGIMTTFLSVEHKPKTKKKKNF